MKKLPHIVLIILLGFFVSCSKEDESYLTANKIIGVWEQDGFEESSGERLVFAPDQNGLREFKIVYSQDNIVSGLIEFVWEINDTTILLYLDGIDSGLILTYSLTPEGELISNDSEEIPFDKISDTIDDYL